ncbi:MAG: ergothioneine biosynthesis protein EgtC [Sciscionella sp.]
MCRHLSYLGPARTLSGLVLDPPHSLLHQSFAPKDMRGPAVANADGFGIGWYTAGRAVRYRRSSPMWTDAGLPELACSISSSALLAAVRSATAGMPVTEAACAPFTDGQFLFSHNGFIAGWPESVEGAAGELSTVELLTLEAPTDAALLWALVRRRLAAGMPPARALSQVVDRVLTDAPGSRLNFMLTDGHSLYATTWTHSLSVLRTAESVVLASEPSDADPRWAPVPDGLVLTATATAVHTDRIE